MERELRAQSVPGWQLMATHAEFKGFFLVGRCRTIFPIHFTVVSDCAGAGNPSTTERQNEVATTEVPNEAVADGETAEPVECEVPPVPGLTDVEDPEEEEPRAEDHAVEDVE